MTANPGNIIVVTGTDTEIGKTMVCAGLARKLSDRGIEVRAVKPVESGIDELEPEQRDGVVLARAARQEEPRRALVELSRPLAPPEAADIDGVTLEMEAWTRRIRDIAYDADVVLVEGAGGLLSPLTWTRSARDLAVELEAPALVVAPNVLGVLNHTLMTLEVLEASSVDLAGVCFSAPAERDEASEHNFDTLRRFSGLDRIDGVPRVEDWEEAAGHLDDVADWILHDLGMR